MQIHRQQLLRNRSVGDFSLGAGDAEVETVLLRSFTFVHMCVCLGPLETNLYFWLFEIGS